MSVAELEHGGVWPEQVGRAASIRAGCGSYGGIVLLRRDSNHHSIHVRLLLHHCPPSSGAWQPKARVQGCREARERARGLRVASCWRPLLQPRPPAGGVGGEVGTHVAPLWPEQPWPKHAKVPSHASYLRTFQSPRFHLRGRSMRRSRQPTPDTGIPSKLGGKSATPAQQMARSSMFLTIM